ncbi:MAG: rhomboid family intramembrane serine protease [Planctomycetaceae bacterium]|nr:rhomboid family intramembrane serine protease [Planctomycetaceae bacterium]
MIIPYGVDVPLDRRPVMNWLLIAATVGAFALQITAPDEESVNAYVLDGWRIQGLFGHMFLHGGVVHLAGNMLFLWVFGNAVCSKVGNLLYVPVYLLFGLLAASTHLLFDSDPAVGASGAINGIVGMFLVFFPLNDINCLWLISIYARTFSVSSYYMILFWLFFDILGAVLGGGGVAYFAHLGGFAAGVGLGILLCHIGWVKMEDDERSLVRIWQEWRQDRADEKLQKQAVKAVEQAKETKPARTPVAIVQRPVTIRFLCQCGQRIKVPADLAGKTGKCPNCRQRIVIPSPEADAAQ